MHGFWAVTASNALIVCMLAAAALLLARVWKNPAALHLIWMAVLFKLFVPPVFTAELPSAPDWMRTAFDIPGFSESWSFAQLAASPAPRTGATARPRVADGRSTAIASQGKSPDVNRIVVQEKPRAWHLSHMLALIWGVGTVFMAMWYAWRISRFRKLLRDAEPPTQEVKAMARQIGERLRLGRSPEIRMTRLSVPPLVWSIGGAPSVILPRELFDRMSVDAQQTILAHELSHVQRRDYLARLLELLGTTLFWWHPVVWLACSKLRQLEEECCDSRVLEIAPHKARVYAAALVDTLDFLSQRPIVGVPLPTAACSAGTLARRICMLKDRRTHRLSFRSGLVVGVITALPLTIALAAEEQAKSATALALASAPIVAGRVTSESGEALADVLVKVAIPAEDMRFVSYGAGFKTLQVRTDHDGQYKLELPATTEATTASVDAMKPGYRSLAGTLMKGGDVRVVDVAPGKVAQASFALERALYVKGVVVDEREAPIAGARIFACADFENASGGIEITASRADGSFEVFNYPLQPLSGDEKFKGNIRFEHPDYIRETIDDIYPMSTEQRESIRLVLTSGRRIAGRVLDASGESVADVMVEATNNATNDDRKAILSDADGRFVLRGLVAGATTIRVHAMKLRQKIKAPITLDRDDDHLELRLQPISLTAQPQTVEVLGMKLANVTPELQAVYDLHDRQGALILDPGKDFARLKIGDLVEGDCFWMVGNQPIDSVREFVERILAETADQKGDEYTCRIVYSFRRVDFIGTNTQYLKLTGDDLTKLRKALAELADK